MHAGRLCRICRKDEAWQKENALKGKVNGIVPLGYIEDSEHHFAIDEAYEPIVRELFARFAHARGAWRRRRKPFREQPKNPCTFVGYADFFRYCR